MPSRTRKARLLGLAFGAAALPGLVLATAGSADRRARVAQRCATHARTGFAEDRRTRQGSLAPALQSAKGTVTVSVALSQKPVGATVAEGSLRTGSAAGEGRASSRRPTRSRRSRTR